MSRRILFLVEGKRAEPRMLRKILTCYDIADEHRIYSVGTNMHVVYEQVLSNGEDMDLLTSLKETASEQERHILSGKYTDIFLIFDSEVHDPKWNVINVRRMLEYFDDSTENGLLLLNYPMYESLRHMSAPGDVGYLDSFVTLEQIRRYKSLVGEEGCQELRDPNKYDKRIFGMLLQMNIWKLGTLVCDVRDRPDYSLYNVENLLRLFDKQSTILAEQGILYVLNTSIMIVLEFVSAKYLV